MVGMTTIRDYDEYTFTHSVNVCIFSVALGKKLGFSKVQLCDLGMTALLHDVGKARVPAEMLNKAGKLDEQEWKIIQAHPWFGALTLFGMRAYEEIPYRSILVAHEHHMKMDLTGYPKVVRPRTLGIFSRIVSVADGFDAATTRRVYQTVPIEPDQVLREMWENPKRGYDRVLVKALINLDRRLPGGHLRHPGHASRWPWWRRPTRMASSSTARWCGSLSTPTAVRCRCRAPRSASAEKDESGAYKRLHRQGHQPRRFGITVGDYFV